MPLLQIKLKDLGSVVDPRPVLREVDRAKRRVLYQQGGYLRRVARNSIKKVGKSRLKKGEELAVGEGASRRHRNILEEAKRQPGSPPGEPPYTHTGHLRGDIVFAVDLAAESVAIGAHKFPWLNELLEHGGSTQRQVWLHRPSRKTFLFHRGPGGNRSGRSAAWKFLRTITVNYPARPFMRAALDKSQDRLATFWKDAVRS
jgi:hypothetical protein